MKKTLILAAVALSTCCASVSAQTLVTNENIGDQIRPGAVIALQCKDKNGGLNYFYNGAAVKSSQFSYTNLFSLEASDSEGSVYLKRLSDGKYVGKAAEFAGSNEPRVTDVESKAEAVAFSIAIPENANGNYNTWAASDNPENVELGVSTVRFTATGSSHFLNCNASGAIPVYKTGKGGYSFWFVYTYSEEEVEALEANTVVYYKAGTPLTSADQLVSGKYFISGVSGGEEAIVHSPNQSGLAAYWSTIKTVPSNGLTDDSYIWSIDVTPATDGGSATFTLTNVGTGKSLSVRGTGQGNMITDANPSIGNIPYVSGNETVASFKLTDLAGDDTYTYVQGGKRFNWQLTNGTFSKEENSTVSTTNYPFVHTNSSGTDRHFSYWENNNDLSNGGTVCRIALIPVKEERLAACAVTLTFPALQNTTVTIPNVQFGTDITTLIPTLDFFTSTGVDEENHIVAADNKTFTVQGTQSLPIQFETVYRMKNKANAGVKYLFYDGTNAVSNNADNETAMVGARLWYFKDAGFTNGRQKVTLHTLALPENYGATLATTNDNQKVTFTASPTTFFIVPNSAATDGGFALQHPNAPKCHLNNRGDFLSTWNGSADTQNNDGSGISVYALADADYEALTAPELTFRGIAPYTPSEELVEAVKTERTLEAFQALFNVQPNVDNLTTGEYFTIKYSRSGKYVYMNGYADKDGIISDADEARKVLKKTSDTVTPDMIWTFVPTDNANVMQIVSPAANNYFIGQNHSQGNNVVVTAQSQWGGRFTPVVNSIDTWGFQIINGDNPLNLYLHDWGGADGDNIGTWSGINDAGNALWVERLTEYTYSIPEGAEYGGLCLPFAVQIPEGVNVYYANATKEGTDGYAQMHLMRLRDVIPARTAVLVKSESSTINFPIETVAAQARLEDNILVGATLRRTGLEADSHYVLHSAGNALVKNGETSELPTGAVALPVSKLSDPAHATDEIHMLIDATTDAIDEISVEGGVAEGIYDLQGRRLAAPVKGINIINGKKVLVK